MIDAYEVSRSHFLYAEKREIKSENEREREKGGESLVTLDNMRPSSHRTCI